MARRWLIAVGTLIAIGAAGAGYAVLRPGAEEGAVESVVCDSCAARKQNLQRVRQALNPPDGAGE